ncbi:uncharacterized protein [Procambarus clarkii]|uniref:uncharacterized protein isoform X2 n=1 Tax=Procambarus clarkii TaxID=6728 RepID=UPI0037431F94
MGDDKSDTSSIWPRDELEFVSEFPLGPQRQPQDSAASRERDEAVSAAVSVVVASARQGVVALCASVAHVIRQKMRLQQNVAELEKKIAAFEKSSSTDMCVTCHCASRGQAVDTHSLVESPSSQRCGSAPPSFIGSSLKLSRGENKNINGCCQINNTRSVVLGDKCESCRQMQRPERRTSSATIPDSHLPTVLKPGEKKTAFLRGQGYASSRSLNIGRSPPSSSFMRKKYSTISLRRVRRSALNKQGVSVGTWSSCSSHRSSVNSLECRGSTSRTSSRSCIVTVAEVYSSPTPCLTAANTESDAIRLLARKLTNVLQASEAQLEDSLPESSPSDSCNRDTVTSLMPEATSYEHLYAPHPLAGCECVVCTHLAADPDTHLYILTTNEGLLLPQGSKVLVQGDRIGTVIYFGHCKYPSRSSSLTQHHLQGSPITSINETVITEVADEGSKGDIDETWGVCDGTTGSLLGVTVALWPPDQGEIFVPLSDVVCQLDDEADMYSKDHILGLDLEYVDDVRHLAGPRISVLPDIHDCPREMTTNEQVTQLPSVQQPSSPLPSEVSEGNCEDKSRPATPEWSRIPEELLIHSPSVSSYNSDYVCSVQESEDEDVTPSRKNSIQVPEQELKSHGGSLQSNKNFHFSSSTDFENIIPVLTSFKTTCLDTTFLNQIRNEEDIYSKTKDSEYKVSLHDTSDSAISLTFTRRPQSSEESSEPLSLPDPDRDSLHLGDTWDSGCCMGRGGYISESPEHFSDNEYENNNLGSPWARNLSEALESIWEKHRNLDNFSLDGSCNAKKMDKPRREAQQRDYSNHLHYLLKNSSIACQFDSRQG